MDIQEIPSLIRSAPGWLIVVVILTLVVVLVAGGPLLGRAILSRRQRELASVFAGNGVVLDHGKWIETGEIPRITDSAPVTVISDRDQRRTLALPAYSGPLGKVEGSQEVAVVFVDEDPADEGDPEPPEMDCSTEKPAWAKESTASWDVSKVLDAEIVETETEAERLFAADPLGCWVLPPNAIEESDYLPEADRVFRDLVARNWLTGEGADVDPTYKPLFTNYELEEVYA